jgi:glycosyltransferase involved in cell wall biosynthesis
VPGADVPVVSCVVPTRGSGRGLGRALTSALTQVGVEVRLVVVVDGPAEDAADREMLATLPEPHRVIQLPRLSHVAVLRNLALNVITTDLVAYLDDDDWWREDKLELQVSVLRESGSVLVGSNALRMVLQGTPTPYHDRIPVPVDLSELLYTNWLITSSVLADARVMRAVGGFPVDPSLRYGLEDYGAWLRIAAVGRVVVMPELLVYYSADSPDSLSRHRLSGEEARRRALRDFLAWSACTGRPLPRHHRTRAARMIATMGESFA